MIIFMSKKALEEKIEFEVSSRLRQEFKLRDWQSFLNSIKKGMYLRFDELNYQVIDKAAKYWSGDFILYLKIGDQEVTKMLSILKPEPELLSIIDKPLKERPKKKPSRR